MEILVGILTIAVGVIVAIVATEFIVEPTVRKVTDALGI